MSSPKGTMHYSIIHTLNAIWHKHNLQNQVLSNVIFPKTLDNSSLVYIVTPKKYIAFSFLEHPRCFRLQKQHIAQLLLMPLHTSGCRKSGLRHFFEVFIAPLRLRRGQGAMQGNPCYARLFADLTRMSPNPIKASGGCGPRTPGGFSTGWLFFSPSPQKGYIPSRTFWNIHSQKHCFALARMVALMGTWQLSCRMKSPVVILAIWFILTI